MRQSTIKIQEIQFKLHQSGKNRILLGANDNDM